MCVHQRVNECDSAVILSILWYTFGQLNVEKMESDRLTQTGKFSRIPHNSNWTNTACSHSVTQAIEKRAIFEQTYPTETQKLYLLDVFKIILLHFCFCFVYYTDIFSLMTFALICFYPSSLGESNFTWFQPLSKESHKMKLQVYRNTI